MRRMIWVVCVFIVFAGIEGFCSDSLDAVMLNFGSSSDDPGWNASGDLNRDEIVDGEDLSRAVVPEGRQRHLTQQSYHRDHILVKFREKLSEEIVQSMVAQWKVTRLVSEFMNRTGYTRLTIPEGEDVASFVETVRGKPGVVAAQPDFICRKSGEPNDQFYRYQWNFDQIRVPEAWDLTGGGRSDVIVAILDTGIAFENYSDYVKAPDLAGTHFVAGYDFINDDNHPNDDEGHGTHVAGTVAQTTNNGIGVAGIAYETALMPVKILGANGVGGSYSLAEGLRWAVDHGADVINMSLGFENQVDPGAVVHDAVRYAHSLGVICVAAAGNAADNPGYAGGVEYPAAYDECVAVGATQYKRRRAYYSNQGAALTCVAPGGDIRVDQNGDGYGDGILQQTFSGSNYSHFDYYFFQGTSMASPHVAAAAALFISRHGGGPQEFFSALAETCIDLGSPGFDQEFGFGLIDLVQIVRKGTGWGADS
jgi:serine protease